MQGRDRDADIENELVDTVGEGESGTNRESSLDIYTNPAPPANNGASGKWIVLGHNPPNLRVHLRPNSHGPGTRLRGALAHQTMVPRIDER